MNLVERCLLVGCGRILEGTVRNILDSGVTILHVAHSDVQQASPAMASGSPSGGSGAEGASGEEEIARARERINALLDSASAPNVKADGDARSASLARFDPNLVIYHYYGDPGMHMQLIGKLRRMCRFRDVPILVESSFSEVVNARKLLVAGADGTLLFPASSENVRASIMSAMQPVGNRMPVITRLINPYISATVDVLDTMAAMRAVKKELFLKKNYRLFGDISGIMTFTGGNIEGAVVVCFEDVLARTVVSRIMRCSPNDLTTTELREGIGELANIISGNAKASLVNTEYAHTMGLPAVATGYGHEIMHPKNAPCIVVLFEVEGHVFAVMVSMMMKG